MKRMLLVWAAAMAIGAGVQARAETADLVLHDGQVLTVDPKFDIASAVAIRHGRIVAVGGEGIVKRFKAAQVIDLHGRTLMPGFMDTHLHIMGRSHRDIDISKAHSIAELQDLIRAKAKALGPGEWITGGGWAEDDFADKRKPVRADLDAAASDNPVVLVRAGGHSAVGNGAALKLAHIDASTPDPSKGLIEHDAGGQPNGVIRERTDLYLALVPADSPDQMRPSYVQAMKALLTLGITSYMEAATSIADEVPAGMAPGTPTVGRSWRQMQQIYAEHGAELPRASVEILYPGAAALKAFPYHSGYGDERLRIGPIGETAVDGGFTGPTAWTLEDYKGQPGFRGRAFYTRAELQDLLDTANRLGWQVGLHAIGDAAIKMAVEAYDESLRKRPGPTGNTRDRRWYLAHFTMLPPEETMRIMARDGIWAAQQPNFTYTLETRYEDNLQTSQVDHINSVATPQRLGVQVAFGSDNLPIDPRVGLYAAITRKGRSGWVHGADEAVSRQEAIRLYTAAGPYLTFEEKKKGTLEVGKFADMIVLDHDPLTAPAEQLLTMKVDLTIIGGKIVYDRAATP